MQQLKRWPGIELRHLEALAVVADEGSFRRAARRLGYTQSAISQQIAALERAVGHAVLERPSRGRPLAMTEVGARLRRLHDTVEHAIAAARADVAAAAAGIAHVVRVGTPFSFSHLSEAVVAMRVRHPRVVVEVIASLEEERLLRLAETGAVDLAVVRMATVAAPLALRPAGVCPYVVAVPAASPAARTKGRLALADLAEYSRIATADGTAFADDVRAPVVATDAEMALGLVGARAGAAVLPAIFASSPPVGVAIRPLRDILPPFRLSIASGAEPARQAVDLADLLVAAIAGWPNAGASGTEDAAAPA